ncbi:neuropeptide Y receptor type 2-like [Gigantopelta aegis]|uniref:neuropeptide Y receptor type 2-like n=1 Tax=Gigantopelta aegis TaxID=1735272 RepID=UPI001B889593|nr:neuropeptide Y receptor type 2-like [Gigantopelta aegis]
MESTNVSHNFEHLLYIDAKDHVMRIHQTMIFMYIFSAALSIIGNVLVIIVLLRTFHRHFSLSSYKINLAVADLCIIVFCVPFTYTQAELGEWVFGAVLCPLIMFLQLCCVCSSAYTNVAIGLDRFLAVLYPLKIRHHFKNRLLVIGLLWLLAAGLACPLLMVAKSVGLGDGNSTRAACNENWSTPTQKLAYTMAVFVIVFVIPTALLSVTYTCVVHTLWKRVTPGNAHAERDRRQLESKKRITWMLISVVTLFVICWLPLHVLKIVIDLDPRVLDSLDDYTLDYLFFMCHWIGVSHAFVNPIIYVITDSEFRTKLWDVLTLKKAPKRLTVVTNRCTSLKSKASRSASTGRQITSTSPVSRNIFTFENILKRPETILFPKTECKNANSPNMAYFQESPTCTNAESPTMTYFQESPTCTNAESPAMTYFQPTESSSLLTEGLLGDSRLGDTSIKESRLADALAGGRSEDNGMKQRLLTVNRLANMLEDRLSTGNRLADNILQDSLLADKRVAQTLKEKPIPGNRFEDENSVLTGSRLATNRLEDGMFKENLLAENIYKDNILQESLLAVNRLADELTKNKFAENRLSDDLPENRLENKFAENRLADELAENRFADNLFAENRLADESAENRLPDELVENQLADEIVEIIGYQTS